MFMTATFAVGGATANDLPPGCGTCIGLGAGTIKAGVPFTLVNLTLTQHLVLVE